MDHKVSIVHAADFHLGSPYSSLPDDKAQLRRREQQVAFSRMIDYCADHQIRILLLAGDIIDQVRFSGEGLRFLKDCFASIPDTRILIAPGNHDPYTDDSPYVCERFPSNVHVFGKGMSSVYFPELHTAVWGAGFTASRSTSSLCPKDFTVASGGYPSDTIQIILMHGEVSDTGTERKNYNPIRRSWISACDADYLALGHVHDRTDPQREGRTFFSYPGCPEARGYDEPGPRGFYAGSITTGGIELSFVPIQVRTYHTPGVDVTGCETCGQVEARILSFLRDTYGGSYTEDAYLISLTGSIRPEFSLNMSLLLSRLKPLVFDLKLRDETGLEIDLENLRRENSLKGRFCEHLMSDIEKNRISGDPDRVGVLTLALKLGLRAFEGGIETDEDP
jgi:DNA repair exonuclease SbcCD nuclease subunit